MSGTVGVIIPTYNENKETLKKAIESAINQTYGNIKVVIVNDGSLPYVENIVDRNSDRQIDYIEHDENKGGSAARNTGADHLDTPYLAFLDADDQWKPQKIEKQVEYLNNQDGEFAACYCDIIDIKRRNVVMNKITNHFIEPPNKNTIDNNVNMADAELISALLSCDYNIRTGGSSTILIKDDLFKQLCGFDERFPRLQDLEFLIRVMKAGKLGYINEKLVMKKESEPPDPGEVESAKKLFLEKFSEDITKHSESNWNIYRSHQHQLGIIHLKNGNLLQGINHIDFSRLETVQGLIRCIWWFVQARYKRLGRSSSFN